MLLRKAMDLPNAFGRQAAVMKALERIFGIGLSTGIINSLAPGTKLFVLRCGPIFAGKA
jgi:hypothetical protein